MSIVGWVLIALSVLGLGLFVLVNPLLTWSVSMLRPTRRRPIDVPSLPVSLIVVVRNGCDLIGPKLDNALALEPLTGGLEIIVHSDGSADGTDDIVAAYANRGVKLSLGSGHRGKAFGLNAAAAMAGGDILVLSDADAILAPDALTKLLSWFAFERVGGVCGRRVVPEAGGGFEAAQAGYVGLDSRIKVWESRLGTLTSNDGKLYAVRRELFPEIPGTVTDDSYAALAVVQAGWEFLFDPEARAGVAVPSRSPEVELKRRRRIVSTSLNAISLHRELLNPAHYGFYALRLGLNKVVRRLMPVFLLLLLLGSVLAAPSSIIAALLLAGQLACMAFAVAFPVLKRHSGGRVTRLSGLAFYFYVGNAGMLWGLVDFLLGNFPHRWTSDKGRVTR